MSKSDRVFYLILSIIGFYFLAFLVLGITSSYLEHYQYYLATNLIKLSFLVLIWFYIKILHTKINGINWQEYFSIRILDIPKFFLGMIIPIVFTIVTLIILKLTNSNLDFTLSNSKTFLELLINNFLISISEELFYRCFIFISLLKIMKGVFLPALISSILFTSVHIASIVEGYVLISLINIFIGGVLLCYLYHLTNSIWTSIGFHTANNTLSHVILYPKQIHDYAYINSLVLYTCLLGTFLIIIFLFVNNRIKSNLTQTN